MDFQLTEEQKMLKRTAREFMEKEIIPIADEYDRRGPLSKEDATWLIRKLIPLGYLSGSLPEEYGGLNLDHISGAILSEELCRAWAGLSGVVGIAAGLPRALVEAGTDEQRKSYLSAALSADIIGCAAITEPDAGSDARSIQTTAVLDGDEWILNGTKTWISNGTIADIAHVICVTDRGKGALGMSALLVEKKVSPFTARELHKLGLRAFPTAELSFVDCRVPKGNQIGHLGDAYQRTMYTFERARTGLCIMGVGIAQAAIDASIKYAQERKQFGRPIGSFQMIQEMICDMVTETEAARLLAYWAYDLIERGERCRKESSIAKAYGTEMAVRVTSKAIQIHGAMGLSDELPVERYFRDARTITIPDGTTQIQKLIVGRETLGIRAFT